MPSIRYMNQSAPFWDFVASLEQQGQSHPFFSQNATANNENNEHAGPGEEGAGWGAPPFGLWGWGHGGRAFPHRGPPPPPPHAENTEAGAETEKEKDDGQNANGEGPSNSSDHEDACPRAGAWGRGRCGGRRGRGFGPYGHNQHGHGPHAGGHGGHHGRGGRGGWRGPWGGRGGPFGGGPFNPLNFAAGLFDPENDTASDPKDFEPEADIFDTESSFVIHVSVPGAKKEDVGVNWDADKSELSIAGVIYRPGDEDFLKTLAMNERKVGPFERKIRLGTRANPAQVDADMITAKLEDGVLRVDVPKTDQGFVEVRKVDIE